MKVSTKDILRVFWVSARKQKARGAVVLLLIFVSEILLLAPPFFYKKIFDVLTNVSDVAVATPLLVQAVIGVGVAYGCSWLFYRLSSVFNILFQTRTMMDLEERAFQHLLGHSYTFFTNAFTGSLVRKVRRLSRAFEDFADQIEWKLLPLVISVVGTLIAIATRSVVVSLALLGFVILIVVASWLFSLWKLPIDVQRSEEDSHVTGALSDSLTNSVNVKLFGGAAVEKGLFHDAWIRFRDVLTRSWRLSAWNEAAQWGLMIVLEVVVLLFSIRLWREGQLTVGDFALFQGFIGHLFGKIWDLGRVIRNMYESFADAKEIVEIMHTPHEIQDVRGAKGMRVKKGNVEFTIVNFAYRAERQVLSDFTLSIAPKEKVALVGPSGAGKSTVVKLLLRFHDIQSGKITIDGQDISRVTQESLRAHVALVPQEPILFHRTLMDNIRYGKRDATDAAVIAASKKARCHEFIFELPDQYQTFVGERGIKLSGGERQRVAIARAILKNAPILVLDEATSSLDSESEALIQEALAELMKNKTTIVIAHRLSTILHMDRIVVMERGQVIDQGTHTELMQKAGLYQKLWNIQSGGFLLS